MRFADRNVVCENFCRNENLVFVTQRDHYGSFCSVIVITGSVPPVRL